MAFTLDDGCRYSLLLYLKLILTNTQFGEEATIIGTAAGLAPDDEYVFCSKVYRSSATDPSFEF